MPQGISTASRSFQGNRIHGLVQRAAGKSSQGEGREQQWWLPLGGKWGNWERSEGPPFSLYGLVYFQNFGHVCVLCFFFFNLLKRKICLKIK